MTATSPREPAANKSALLCAFYYGDDKLTTLGQETLPIGRTMEGYARRVLLKHDEIPSWCDLSDRDEKLADVIALPTQANLFAQLIDLTEKGYYIDPWSPRAPAT